MNELLELARAYENVYDAYFGPTKSFDTAPDACDLAERLQTLCRMIGQAGINSAPKVGDTVQVLHSGSVFQYQVRRKIGTAGKGYVVITCLETGWSARVPLVLWERMCASGVLTYLWRPA
jgi:hypothetical protein